jgi:hypothetical protein
MRDILARQAGHGRRIPAPPEGHIRPTIRIVWAFLLDGLVPLLSLAVDGDPATVVPLPETVASTAP